MNVEFKIKFLRNHCKCVHSLHRAVPTVL